MEVKKEMKVFDILITNIKAIEIFKRHNMSCFLCNGAHDESLELAAKANNVDINILVEELNNI